MVDGWWHPRPDSGICHGTWPRQGDAATPLHEPVRLRPNTTGASNAGRECR